ncbi:MAG: NADH-quinone oxidoreductase subunit J [Dehalococcoidia bacterium]
MEGFGPALAFYALSALTLIAAGGVMVSRNLMHAVLFLIVTFIGVAGFFILLSAEFLAMAQVIIYVGAIAVLVLFAILLTPRSLRDNGETKMALPAAMLAAVLAAITMFVVHDTDWNQVEQSPDLAVAEIGDALLNTWVVPFELASVLLTAALIGSIMLVRSPEEEAEDALK